MNKQKILTALLCALSMALGWLLPGISLFISVDFALASLIIALSQVLMFGLPAFLILSRFKGASAIKLALFERPGTLDAGLTMMTAVTYVMTGAMISSLFFILLDSLGIKPEVPEPLIPKTLTELFVLSLAVAVVTPLCEELFFREALPFLLKMRMGPGLAGLISSLLFTSMHLNLVGFPTLFFFGLLAFGIKERRQNLGLAILFHAMYNFSILLMNYTQATPGIEMAIASLIIFVFALRALLKEERHGNDPHHSGL